MMKLYGCIFVLLAVFLTYSSAAVAIGSFNDPRYPGKCTINETLILSPGDEIKDPNPNLCGRISCAENGEAEFATCGVMGAPDGCKIGDYVNLKLPYPDCCKRQIICD